MEGILNGTFSTAVPVNGRPKSFSWGRPVKFEKLSIGRGVSKSLLLLKTPQYCKDLFVRKV